MSSDQPLVEVVDLRCWFGQGASPFAVRRNAARGAKKAVDGVDFTIRRGQTLGIVGESGSGKSTIARCLAGLEPSTGGSIRFDGIEIGALRVRKRPKSILKRIQMIFQDPYSSLNPRWRIREIIAEPLRNFRLVETEREKDRRVDELLELVGLTAPDGRKHPREFSGGQRQRISIARALSSAPDFLICDEPTSALDVSVQARILNLLRDLQDRFGLTYILISHNLATVYQMADHVAVLNGGRICEMAEAETLFKNPQAPYTRMLLQSIPRLDDVLSSQPAR